MTFKKLHYSFGLCVPSDTDSATIANLAKQHRMLLIEDKHFSNQDEFENWAFSIGSADPTNMSTEYRGIGTRQNNTLIIKQGVGSIPAGGMPYLGTAGSGAWHQDRPHTSRSPTSFTVIQARTIPEVGGHTIIADLTAAWQDLSEQFKQLLRGQETVNLNRALHLWTHKHAHEHRDIYDKEFNIVPHTQPLVVKDTNGIESLNFSPKNCINLAGMHEEESRGIIEFLTKHVTRPEYQYRHAWKPNQILMFSNQHTCHYGVRDYHSQERMLWQTIMDL